MPLTIGGASARTLCLEDLLQHIYFHGFRAPLTYEPFRLIHAADIITLIEGHGATMNWQELATAIPSLPTILSAFHWITPWPDSMRAIIALDTDGKPARPGAPYQGWPLHRWRATPLRRYPALAWATLCPPQWWIQVYYGKPRGPSSLRARLFDHPRVLWRWLKTYSLPARKASSSSRSSDQ